MENLLVLIIVLAATSWAVFRLVRKRKVTSCSSGSCAGCSCSAKPAPRLVTLRR